MSSIEVDERNKYLPALSYGTVIATFLWVYVAIHWLGDFPPLIILEVPILVVVGALALSSVPKEFGVLSTAVSTTLIATGIATALDAEFPLLAAYIIEAGLIVLAISWVVLGFNSKSDGLDPRNLESYTLISGISFLLALLLSTAADQLSLFLAPETVIAPVLRSAALGAAWYLDIRTILASAFVVLILLQALVALRAEPFRFHDWLDEHFELAGIPMPLRLVIAPVFVMLATGVLIILHVAGLMLKAAVSFIMVSVPQLIVGMSGLIGSVTMLSAHWLLFQAAEIIESHNLQWSRGLVDVKLAQSSFIEVLLWLLAGVLVYLAAIPALCLTRVPGKTVAEWNANIKSVVSNSGYPLLRSTAEGLGILAFFIVAVPTVGWLDTGDIGPFSLWCIFLVAIVLALGLIYRLSTMGVSYWKGA